MDSGRQMASLILDALKSAYIFLRYVGPPLLMVVVAVMDRMIGTSVSIIRGLKPEIDRIARKIKDDSANYVPTNLHGALDWFSQLVAYITVILVFVLISHLTVWIWQWLWSFL